MKTLKEFKARENWVKAEIVNQEVKRSYLKSLQQEVIDCFYQEIQMQYKLDNDSSYRMALIASKSFFNS